MTLGGLALARAAGEGDEFAVGRQGHAVDRPDRQVLAAVQFAVGRAPHGQVAPAAAGVADADNVAAVRCKAESVHPAGVGRRRGRRQRRLNVGCANSFSTAPSATFHTFTVRSLEPEAIVLPSGENATQKTPSRWPLSNSFSLYALNSFTTLPVAASHSFKVSCQRLFG